MASSATRADPARPGPTGFIAFVSERQPERDVYLVPAAGGPAERLTTAPGDDYPAAVSPDRRTLVTVRAETRADGAHRERLELLVVLGERGRERGAPPVFEARELTSPSGRWRNPVWLPDAGAVVAESDRDGFVALYRVPLDGRAPERLTDDRTGSFDPSVDPRGAFVAFASSRDGDAELYRLDLGSRELRRLTWSEGDDATPRFAPDGSAIAYTSLRRGAFRAYLMGPDGAHPRPLLGAADAAEGAETGFLAHEELVWSPDATRIALVERRTGRASVRVIRVADGVELAHTEGPHDQTPVWSPDGAFVALASDRSGDVEVYRMRADGSELVALTSSPGADWLPRWIAE